MNKIIKLKDVTKEMQSEAIKNAPDGSFYYYFNSKTYYAEVAGLTFQYVDSIKMFALSMRSAKGDVRMFINSSKTPQICIKEGCMRTVEEDNSLGWFQAGSRLTDHIISINSKKHAPEL